MLNVSITEFIVFVILAILILGPEKLPFVLAKARSFYKKTKYVFDSNIYDLEAQIEKYYSPIELSRKQYIYLDPIAFSPYHSLFIQQLFRIRSNQLCTIGLIHQLHSHALQQEIWAAKIQQNLQHKASIQHLQEVA
ncbi:Sec-independent protein translocase subunit TatA/TatB [Acinetobacter sp. NigerLNRRAM0016]